nr:unnamed protein product [Callosobruchus analis]
MRRANEAIQSNLAPRENCLNYLDDIIIYGCTEIEHDRCLNQVLEEIPSKPNQDRNISLTIPISVQQEEDAITDQTTKEDDANTYQHEEDQVPTAKVEPLRLEKKEGLWRPALRAQRVEAEARGEDSRPRYTQAIGSI